MKTQETNTSKKERNTKMGDRRKIMASKSTPKQQAVTTEDALQCFVDPETRDAAKKTKYKEVSDQFREKFRKSIERKSIYHEQMDNWSFSQTVVTKTSSGSTTTTFPVGPKRSRDSPPPADPTSSLPPSAQPAKVRRKLTRAVPLDWYFRYANVLPQAERVILQPALELLPEERDAVLRGQRKQMGVKSSLYLHIMNTPGMTAIVSPPTTTTKTPNAPGETTQDKLKKLPSSSKFKKDRTDVKKENPYDIKIVNDTFGKTMLLHDRKKLKKFFVRKLRLRMIAKVQRSRNTKNSQWTKLRDRKVYIFSKLNKMRQEMESKKLLSTWMTLVTTVKSMVQFGAAIKEIARSTECVQSEIDLFMNQLIEEQKRTHQGAHFDTKTFAVNAKNLSQHSIYNLTMPSGYRCHNDIKSTVEELLFVRSFSRFPKELQYLFAKMGWYNVIAKHRVIIRQGQRPQMFYFIISGRAIVVRLIGSANFQEASGFQLEKYLYAGQSFGYQKLFDIGMDYRYTTVTSLEHTTMLGIDIDDFLYYMSQRGLQAERQFKEYRVPPYIPFILSMDLFRDFNEELLCTEYKRHRNIIPFYFEPGACITKKTLDSKYVFVVRTGRVHVLIKTIVNSQKRTSISFFRPPKAYNHVSEEEHQESNEYLNEHQNSAITAFFRPPKSYSHASDEMKQGSDEPTSRHLKKDVDATSNCITDDKIFVDEIDSENPIVYFNKPNNADTSHQVPSNKDQSQKESAPKKTNEKLPRVGVKRSAAAKNYSSNSNLSTKQSYDEIRNDTTKAQLPAGSRNEEDNGSKTSIITSAKTGTMKNSMRRNSIGTETTGNSRASRRVSIAPNSKDTSRRQSLPRSRDSELPSRRRSMMPRGSVHFNTNTVFTESNNGSDISVDSIQEEMKRMRNRQGKWESEADRMVESINASSSYGLLTMQMASSIEKMLAAPNSGSLKRYCWVHLGDSWPRDALGLEDMEFGDDLGPRTATHAAIISDGAECLCIKKSFIREGATPKFRAQVRSMGYTWPTQAQIHAKLRAGADWTTYKGNLRADPNKPYPHVPMDDEVANVNVAEMDRSSTCDRQMEGTHRERIFKVVTGRNIKDPILDGSSTSQVRGSIKPKHRGSRPA